MMEKLSLTAELNKVKYKTHVKRNTSKKTEFFHRNIIYFTEFEYSLTVHWMSIHL